MINSLLDLQVEMSESDVNKKRFTSWRSRNYNISAIPETGIHAAHMTTLYIKNREKDSFLFFLKKNEYLLNKYDRDGNGIVSILVKEDLPFWIKEVAKLGAGKLRPNYFQSLHGLEP
ncbi:hypothetical protein Ciccas_013973 [Cichlidogyrus casuarinus]|uniref:Uncharacterized protein n=1 Tax=Cichlidogyrus casuarinus TaxID=1844966 RepID=A0ABD2PJY2_9PLAT